VSGTLLAVAVVLVVAVAVWIASKRKQKDAAPNAAKLPHFQSSPEPKIEAAIWAANYYPGELSEICQINSTGSMLPTLQGGEWAVLAHDFAGIKLGDVVAYRTVGGSSPEIGHRLVHRIVSGDAQTGWIPKGDTWGNPIETWNPITEDNYIGTLVAAFRSV